MNYQVEGSFTVTVTVDVHADNETAAIELAKNHLKEYYRLDVHGASHNPKEDVSFDLDVFEEDTES